MVDKADERAAVSKDAEKKTDSQKRAEKVLKFLNDRSEDRGIMADLRCALVEGKTHRAWPYLGYIGGIGRNHKERTVQTIAGLFANHPKTTHEGDFGIMCRKLLGDEERKKLDTAEGVGPITRRFQHLLAAEGEEIFDRVIRFVLRAKSEEIPVNYAELYASLNYWQWPDSADRVKTDWAKSFWTPQAHEEGDEE